MKSSQPGDMFNAYKSKEKKHKMNKKGKTKKHLRGANKVARVVNTNPTAGAPAYNPSMLKGMSIGKSAPVNLSSASKGLSYKKGKKHKTMCKKKHKHSKSCK